MSPPPLQKKKKNLRNLSGKKNVRKFKYDICSDNSLQSSGAGVIQNLTGKNMHDLLPKLPRCPFSRIERLAPRSRYYLSGYCPYRVHLQEQLVFLIQFRSFMTHSSNKSHAVITQQISSPKSAPDMLSTYAFRMSQLTCL